MQSLSLAAVGLMIGALAAAGEPTIRLFSAAEADAWNRRDQAPPAMASRELPQPGVPSCRSTPGSAVRSGADPAINIIAPALGKPLSAPFDIDVQFVPGGPAIRAETFRVCYVGFLTIDITARITEHVAVSAQGLHVSGADLPRGQHHLMLLIADVQGHFGIREATFEIR